mmetsp:Transcript_41466/g.130631  ORF Transcript_41466/g.130631 Transcript_41466/m.130631 type:complete len:369 (-) Transcript_41466:501-1607(-)
MKLRQLPHLLLVAGKVNSSQLVNEVLPAGEEDERGRVIAVVLVCEHDGLLTQRALELRAPPPPALLYPSSVLLYIPLGVPPEGRIDAELQEEVRGRHQHRHTGAEELVKGGGHVVLRDPDHGLEPRGLLCPVVPPIVHAEPVGAEEGRDAEVHLVVHERNVSSLLLACSSDDSPVRHQHCVFHVHLALLLVVQGVHSRREQEGSPASPELALLSLLLPGSLIADARRIDHFSMRPVDAAPVLSVPALEEVACYQPDVGSTCQLPHELVEILVREVGGCHLLLRELEIDVLVGEVKTITDVEEDGLSPAVALEEGTGHGGRVGDQDHVKGLEEDPVCLPHQLCPPPVHVVVEPRALRVQVDAVVEVKRL